MRRRRPPCEPPSRASSAPRSPVFGALPSGTLARRAAGAFALGLLPLLLQLGREPFALLYGLDLGLGMVLLGTATYLRDQRGSGHQLTAGDVAVPLGALGLFWLLIFLAIVAAWSVQPSHPVLETVPTAFAAVDWRVTLAAALLVAWALVRLRAVLRGPVTPFRGLEQPVVVRALCVTAFVIFGPGAFTLFRELGASEPVAVALAFGLSEAYPFVATLIDRGLDRIWPTRAA